MLASAERFHEGQAAELIQQVWEFVVETCNVEGLHVPDKELAIQKLKKHINKHFN
jgi:predicted RNase H-like HicB family nuclease